MVLASVGSAATAVVRPLADSVPCVVPLLIGAGPIAVQESGLSGIEFEGARRVSKRKSRGWNLVRRLFWRLCANRWRGIVAVPRSWYSMKQSHGTKRPAADMMPNGQLLLMSGTRPGAELFPYQL